MCQLLRRVAFTILFYGLTALGCILFIPFLLLPRQALWAAVRAYERFNIALECHVLGLKWDVRGRENLPLEGPYIAAIKHQSAHETLRLFHMFGNPAVILKRELTWIPIWGWLAKKAGNVAINRGKGREALDSILRGAAPVFADKRVLVIFPQGTRVKPTETSSDKPYKFGVGRLYEKCNVPVVPIALNTGVFWPKGALLMKPGTAVYQVLPAIQPGLPASEMMKLLESQLEAASAALVQEALAKDASASGVPTETPAGER
jgi:1-acyl-sn-glycerol-3-phosphate acyltransferase